MALSGNEILGYVYQWTLAINAIEMTKCEAYYNLLESMLGSSSHLFSKIDAITKHEVLINQVS